MSSSRFSVIAAVALAAVLAAVLLVSQRAPESEGSLLGEPVLPGLSERLNDVTALRFSGAGGAPLVGLVRSGTVWTVVERHGHPAAADKVRLALINLAESRVLEPKTANPDRHAQLGVESLEGEGASGVLVEVESPGQADRMIIGNYAGQQGEGTYVRRPDEARSLMASGNLVPEREPAAWLQRELLDIPSSQIREVELSGAAGGAVRVFKESAAQENFTVADLPRGRTVQSAFVANGLASTLSGLSLEDVARDQGEAGPPSHSARYRLFDGRVVIVEGWHGGTDDAGNAAPSWATLKVEVDDQLARAAIVEQLQAEAAAAADQQGATGEQGQETAADGPDEVSDAALVLDEAAVAARLDTLHQEVAVLSERFAGWRYQLPAFKFANLDKGLEDMLQPRD
ncbi:MAG: DUF4340 domain-containing protein [Xanthomonadales bacterium]|nr:DUF4340 domain-containing protein [Xanthomonadales bacterium]